MADILHTYQDGFQFNGAFHMLKGNQNEMVSKVSCLDVIFIEISIALGVENYSSILGEFFSIRYKFHIINLSIIKIHTKLN